MCYSAQIKADFKRFAQAFGALLDLQKFIRLYWEREQGRAIKIPKAVDALLQRLEDLYRTEPNARDGRFLPEHYAPVLVMEDGERVIKPMRYQCRSVGKPPFYNRKNPGTYNALGTLLTVSTA